MDFGEGFYTTFSREQACRWSSKVFERRNDGSPILNIYEYDRFEAAEKLKIRTFEKPDAEWLRFVISNRTSDFFHDFDIVEGPVANDTMYSSSSDSRTAYSPWTRRSLVSNPNL